MIQIDVRYLVFFVQVDHACRLFANLFSDLIGVREETKSRSGRAFSFRSVRTSHPNK